MSYCRFGEADAYIYDDINNGLVCAACLLMPYRDNELFPDTFIAGYDRQKMLDHIAEHRYIGDRIPFEVDERLREEMTHDPLCPIISTTCIDGPHVLILEAAPGYKLCDVCFKECQCDLIAKVEHRCTPNHFRERIEKLITKANRWRDENVELRKQLKELS